MGLAFCLLVGVGHVHGAAELGRMRVGSAPGEPLQVGIELIENNATDPRPVSAILADRSAYQQRGLIYPDSLAPISISVFNVGGKAMLRLNSANAPRDRLVSLLIDIRWSDGQYTRQAAVLETAIAAPAAPLPPVQMAASDLMPTPAAGAATAPTRPPDLTTAAAEYTAEPAAPPAAPANLPAVNLPSLPATSASDASSAPAATVQAVPSQTAQTTQIAPAPTFQPPPSSPPLSSPQMAVVVPPPAPVLAPPAPALTPAATMAPVAPAPIARPAARSVATPQPARAAAPPVADVPAAAPTPRDPGGGKLRLQAGDTPRRMVERAGYPDAWNVAAAIAIYRANPQAFDGNLYRPRAGSSLTLPSMAEVAAIDVNAAREQMRTEYSGFIDQRARLADAPRPLDRPARRPPTANTARPTPPSPPEAARATRPATPAPTAAATPAPERGDHLTLSRSATPTRNKAPGGKAADSSAGGSSQAERKVALQMANYEMSSRIDDLQKNIVDLRSLLALKDQQIAAFQKSLDTATVRNSLAKLPTAAPATPVARPATPITVGSNDPPTPTRWPTWWYWAAGAVVAAVIGLLALWRLRARRRAAAPSAPALLGHTAPFPETFSPHSIFRSNHP